MLGMRNGEVSIVDGLNFYTFYSSALAAFQNPIPPQGRQALNWVERHAWIAPGAAGVVNADRLVHFDFAGHRLGWREADFTERHAKIGMQFPGDVNLFAVRERLVASLRWFETVLRLHRFTAILRDVSVRAGLAFPLDITKDSEANVRFRTSCRFVCIRG